MIKIVQYSFYDLVRSRWSFVYFAFYMLLGFSLLFLNNNVSKAIITMMNIIIVLTPMIGTIFGVMYFYNSREFTELLMAQPIRRSTLFFGQYLGISISLSLSLVIGLGVPFVFYGLFQSAEIWNFSMLLLIGSALTFIFVALAMNISLRNENKIKGFGYAILLWLFMAVIYDGLMLILLNGFREYPLDKSVLFFSMLNPIDLSRILILLKLDISALLGHTGAVFQKFFGTNLGLMVSFSVLILWVLIPAYTMIKVAKKKDF